MKDLYAGLADILAHIKKLNNIGRWSNEFLHQRASVSEHSFSVCQISQMLGVIEEKIGNQVDWKSLYRKALNHDVPESLVGDVISTTKNASEESKNALLKVEKDLINLHLLTKLLSPFKEEYDKIIFDGKDTTIEGQILQAADNLDALLECVQEVKLFNKDPFEKKYYAIMEMVKTSELESVRIFLKYILPGFVGECVYLLDGNY